MLKTFDEVCNLINEGKLLQIAGAGSLLKKLPKGNWVGGTQEHFLTEETGGTTTNEKLFVTQFGVDENKVKSFEIKEYNEVTIKDMPKDSHSNGFSIVIIPFGTSVFVEYSKNSINYEDIFLKNIVGWVSAYNLAQMANPIDAPLVFNGMTGEVLSDRAVVLHMEIDKTISIGILNIFEADEKSQVVTFPEETISIKKAFIDGKEVDFLKYLEENNINLQNPLVGDYSGQNINCPFIPPFKDGIVTTGIPVQPGINYYFSKSVENYEKALVESAKELENKEVIFTINCALNFAYGNLEGKKIKNISGPISFGEIAYKMLTQTMVYVEVLN